MGPEVVQRALAQLVGTCYVPIGFSFGWVAYSINALLAIAGGKVDTHSPLSLLTYEDGQLMPEADCQALVVTAQSGHHRINKAWIIGRLLRDFEKRTTPFASSKSSPEWEALRVSIFQWDERREQRKPIRDWVWYSGLAVVVLQISIAAVPLALWSEWEILALVAGGILLASAQAALPQWKSEKWACPSNGTIGMIQNIVVAASPRSSSAFGLHLHHVNTIKARKVSKALMITEQFYPGVGSSLLPIFNPGGLSVPDDQVEFWQSIKDGNSQMPDPKVGETPPSWKSRSRTKSQ
ncbi:MAG: hypothetical protein Q9195_005442 [Heterodermia aff. obscurata]